MMNPRLLLPVLLILVGCDSLGDYFTTQGEPELERVELSSLPLVQYDTPVKNPIVSSVREGNSYETRTLFLRPDLTGPYTGPVIHSVVDEVTGYTVVREWGRLLGGQKNGWWLSNPNGQESVWMYMVDGKTCREWFSWFGGDTTTLTGLENGRVLDDEWVDRLPDVIEIEMDLEEFLREERGEENPIWWDEWKEFVNSPGFQTFETVDMGCRGPNFGPPRSLLKSDDPLRIR